MRHKLSGAGWLLIFLLNMPSLYAQESRTLTLKEAVDLSLKYNKQLKADQLKIADATASVKAANEQRLPDAGISGSYIYLPVRPSINLKSGSNSGNGGGEVNQAIYGIASVSLPVYTGGKLKYGIESAKYLEQAFKSDADNNREAVILNTITACINLYKAHEAINLVKENLEQSQRRVKDLSNLEKNGLLARNDLLKAELQSSNIELTLLDAENNYKLASVNMNLMMGLPEQTVLIPDRTGLALPSVIKTIEEYEQDALQNRNDVHALTFHKKAANTGIQIAKADYYPTIALTGGYVAADIPHFFSVVNAVNIGVGIKYNFSSLWKTKTKIQQAEIKVQQWQTSEEILNDNIRLQINQAFEAYLLSRKKTEVYEKSVEQATENYRVTKNKYDNALATTTELLDADIALLQSKLSVTNAKADSFLAYNKLLQIAGLLTNY